MKINYNVRCGLPSSSKLHNPEVKRLNRMESRARAILLERKRDKAEAARQAQRDAKAQQEELAAVIDGKPSMSRLGRLWQAAKARLGL